MRIGTHTARHRLLVAAACWMMLCVVGRPTRATTWTPMDLRDIVFGNADLIVSGKIVATEAAAPMPESDGRVALVEVKTVLYGSGSTKTVRLRADSTRHGLSYQIGDSGTWFLRRAALPPARTERAEAQQVATPVPRPPAVDADSGSDAEAATLFEAEHPSTFWPDDTQSFARRNAIRMVYLDTRARKERMQRLLGLLEQRLAADQKRLSAALESTRANLKTVKEVRDAE